MPHGLVGEVVVAVAGSSDPATVLSVTLLSVTLLSVTLLSVTLLSVTLLSVTLLSVTLLAVPSGKPRPAVHGDELPAVGTIRGLLEF
jgi:hypothetical protein